MARYLERAENHRDTGWRHELLHLLYRPASLGRQRRYRVRFPSLHKVHLIPGRVMDEACFRYGARAEPPPEPPVEVRPTRWDEALRRRAHP